MLLVGGSKSWRERGPRTRPLLPIRYLVCSTLLGNSIPRPTSSDKASVLPPDRRHLRNDQIGRRGLLMVPTGCAQISYLITFVVDAVIAGADIMPM